MLDKCIVERCIISGAVVRNQTTFRNTIIIDAFILDSELDDCVIIQSTVERCKIVNCSIRKENSSDSSLNIPTELELSDASILFLHSPTSFVLKHCPQIILLPSKISVSYPEISLNC